ncbi:hypothetical protein ACVIF9_008366 [Bradyrhizobium sp. USDA 4350]
MIGSLMMCVGVLVLLFGMLAGIAMGIQHDFTLGPAHAHLNLVGGVLLFLFGLYYRLVPAAGTMLLARIQGWLHIVGGILFPAGVARRVAEGPGVRGGADRGIADGGRRHGPVHGRCIPHLAGVIAGSYLHRRPGPNGAAAPIWQPIRGIVRATDSPRPDRRIT